MRAALFPACAAILAGAASADPVTSADPVGRMQAIVTDFCGKSDYADDWLHRSDLNGDGIDDIVIEYKLACYDLPAPFCGASGCMTELWYGLPGERWQLVLRTNMLGIGPVAYKDVPAVRIATVGLACGKTHGQICESVNTFSGGEFLTLWSNAEGE